MRLRTLSLRKKLAIAWMVYAVLALTLVLWVMRWDYYINDGFLFRFNRFSGVMEDNLPDGTWGRWGPYRK